MASKMLCVCDEFKQWTRLRKTDPTALPHPTYVDADCPCQKDATRLAAQVASWTSKLYGPHPTTNEIPISVREILNLPLDGHVYELLLMRSANTSLDVFGNQPGTKVPQMNAHVVQCHEQCRHRTLHEYLRVRLREIQARVTHDAPLL